MSVSSTYLLPSPTTPPQVASSSSVYRNHTVFDPMAVESAYHPSTQYPPIRDMSGMYSYSSPVEEKPRIGLSPLTSTQGSARHSGLLASAPVMDRGSMSGQELFPMAMSNRAIRDMNMAPTGSTASKAGIETPLAQYTAKQVFDQAAQMVVWLWFGRHMPSSAAPYTSPSNISATPAAPPSAHVRDPFGSPIQPLNPLQLAPTTEFTRFVSRMLQITMVSHSVTLIALLYIHRLKSRYCIDAGPGTEVRPFLASLILSNKYLDDNTYTNKTWAELSGLSVHEINKMEHEFLHGLEYRLTVDKTEYLTWRRLLDGFIIARQYEASGRRFHPNDISGSPHSAMLVTPHSAVVTSQPYVMDPVYRSRSESPGQVVQATPPPPYQNFVSPASARKRTAGDAFANDPVAPAGVYESLRLPPKKAQAVFTPPVFAPSALNPPWADHPTVQSSSLNTAGLGRSTSLNRRIARLPGSNITAEASEMGRRGSAGNIYSIPPGIHEQDLRHAIAQHRYSYDQHHIDYSAVPIPGHTPYTFASTGHQPYTYGSLIAPCDQNIEAHNIPPEHLQFYTIAADPHPGQDGAPRKAILRYQEAPPPVQHHPYSYPPRMTGYPPQGSAPYSTTRGMSEEEEISPTYNVRSHLAPYGSAASNSNYSYPAQDLYASHAAGTSHSQYPSVLEQPHTQGYYVEPEPAVFANAGPPGWTYDPNLYIPGQRWSTGSDEMARYADTLNYDTTRAAAARERLSDGHEYPYSHLAGVSYSSTQVPQLTEHDDTGDMTGYDQEMYPYYPPSVASASGQYYPEEVRSKSEWNSPIRGGMAWTR